MVGRWRALQAAAVWDDVGGGGGLLGALRFSPETVAFFPPDLY